MSSWNLIGWALIAIFATLVGIRVLTVLLSTFLLIRAKCRSRNVRPEVGQVWIQSGNKELIVTKVSDYGVGLRSEGGCSTATWSDSWAEWENRKKHRHAFLKTLF